MSKKQDKRIWIEWLEPPEWLGVQEDFPAKLITGKNEVGNIVSARWQRKNWKAKIVEMPRLATLGTAPFSEETRKIVGKSKVRAPTPDYEPSSSDSENETLADLRQQKKKNEEKAEIPTTSSSVSHTEQDPEVAEVFFEEDFEFDYEEDIQSTTDDSDSEYRKKEITEKSSSSGSRWRHSDPEKWKRNIRKKMKLSGEAHVNSAGKQVAKKAPNDVENHKCIFQCRNFKPEHRKEICASYWSLGNYERQKDFILANITTEDCKRRCVDEAGGPKSTRKQQSISYHLNLDGVRTRVCKLFFLGTLCISKTVVYNAIQGKSLVGKHFVKEDGRGKAESWNKVSEEQLKKIHSHIESFPVVESHYCRKGTKRQFLSSDLSISKMYQLYCQAAKDEGFSPVGRSKYQNVFCTEYNLGFFIPKKDQCQTCETYRQAPAEEKEALKGDYEAHLMRKEKAQSAKASAKEKAAESSNFEMATFDLQSVLQLPSSEISQMYYKRKLSAYNLTIFSSKEKHGICNLWNEINGQRGSTEISSCLFDYLKALPETVKEVCLFSDSCGGQNRNQFVAAMLLYSVQKIPNIEIITQNFLEPGHTQMECDSMHSAIEKEKGHKPVYTVHGWENIMLGARRKQPYKVNIYHFGDFYDVKNLAQGLIRNRNKLEDGRKVNWLKIKSLKFEKSKVDVIGVKLDYDDEYSDLRVRRSGGRGRPSLPDTLNAAYSEEFSISEEKKKDLLELCRSKAIPAEFRGWYQGLKSSNHVADAVITESDDSSDEGSESDIFNE